MAMSQQLMSDPTVTNARQGDPAAYGELVDRYRNLVSSVCLAIVRDVKVSEEVAQEVFLAGWRGLSTLRDPDSFLPWLRQLARNHANDACRRRMREATHVIPLNETIIGRTEGPNSARPDTQLVNHEEQQFLERALDQLPAESKEVITLFYREGQSISEVADQLDLTRAAVKKRLERGRTQLRLETAKQFAEIVARTAPGAAFTAAVIAAMAGITPAAASAAGVTSVAGVTGIKSLALLAALFPALMGALGEVLVYRRVVKKARDDQEIHGWRWLGIGRFLVMLCWLGGAFGAVKMHSGGLLILVSQIFAASGLASYFFRRKIVSRRQAMERSEDPHAAGLHRKEDRSQRTLVILKFLIAQAFMVRVLWYVHLHGWA